MTNGESVCLSEREQKPLKWYRISHYRAWDHHHHLSLPPAFSPFEVEIVPTRELYSRQQFWLYLSLWPIEHWPLTAFLTGGMTWWPFPADTTLNWGVRTPGAWHLSSDCCWRWCEMWGSDTDSQCRRHYTDNYSRRKCRSAGSGSSSWDQEYNAMQKRQHRPQATGRLPVITIPI